MVSDRSDIPRYSRNFNGLLFAGGGLTIYAACAYIAGRSGVTVPPVLVTAIYFVIVSAIYRKTGGVYFILVSFLFLSVYFKAIYGSRLSPEGIWNALASRKLPIILYALVILPASFLGNYIDVFSLAKNSGGAGNVWLRYFVPVLIKRELVLKRHKEVMEALYAKGYDTRRRLTRYRLARKWIIPVVITTLMEGVESYEYNLMLNHDITLSGNKKNVVRATAWQWVLFALLTAVDIIFFVL